MLQDQLNGVRASFKYISKLGQGGNGKVFKKIEKHTGLVVAEKQILVHPGMNYDHVLKEISYMKSLVHVSFKIYKSLASLTTIRRTWFCTSTIST